MGEPVAMGVLSLADPERYADFYSPDPSIDMVMYFAYADMYAFPRAVIEGMTSNDDSFAASHLRYLLRSMPGSQVIHPNDLPFGTPYNPTDDEVDYITMRNALTGVVDTMASAGGNELFAEYLAWLAGVVGVAGIDEWFYSWNNDDDELAFHYRVIRHTGMCPERVDYYRAGVFDDEVIADLMAADVDASLSASLVADRGVYLV